RKCGDFSRGVWGRGPPGRVITGLDPVMTVLKIEGYARQARLRHRIRQNALSILLRAAYTRGGRGNADFGFQCGDARLQRLVLLACQPRHVLDGLELLALDDIEVTQDFFGLIADEGVDFALDAL